jgi:hypothetical protein
VVGLLAKQEDSVRRRSKQLCPIHRFLSCCGREAIAKEQRRRQLGVRRIDDPQRPRGYRELHSNREMQKLTNCKIAAQNGICGICKERFTVYSDVVPDHISLRGMGGAWRDDRPTTFRPCTGGATARRDRAVAEEIRDLESLCTEEKTEIMASTAQEKSLFEIDREFDTLLDEIEEEIENRGEASGEVSGWLRLRRLAR